MNKKFVTTTLLGALGIAMVPLMTAQADAQSAKATLIRAADGKPVGTTELVETPAGVLLKVSVKDLPPGDHALHVHEVGKCEAPFASAGGHFNPERKKHGLEAADGYHAGDMPNLHIPEGGSLVVEVLNTAITLKKDKPNSVFDADGSAIVIHAGKDDYKTDPTGDAGGRIACGVIE